MKKITPIAFLILLFSCSQQPETKNPVAQEKKDTIQMAEPPDDYVGTYHPEQYKNAKDSALYTFNPYVQHMLDSMYNNLLPHPYPNQTVFFSFRGSPDSLPTNTGTKMGLIGINSMELKNADNCPIPYDYWCSGNEPFWQLEISEKENLIDFYNPMNQTTIHFIYSKPEIKKGNTSYSAIDENKKNKIVIKITNEKCSDGMSEKEYDSKVEFSINGKPYKGCAVKYNK